MRTVCSSQFTMEPLAGERRFPTRRRRSSVVSIEPSCPSHQPMPTAPVAQPPGGDAYGDGALLTVTPDLIFELVDNGSLAAHFRLLHGIETQPGWRSFHTVETEVECGSTLFVVDMDSSGTPAPPTAEPSHGGGTSMPAFLMRAFQRRSPNQGSAVAPKCTQHIFTNRSHALDDWAPVSVLHLVKALELCGLSLVGFHVMHQTHHSTHVVPVLPVNPLSGIAPRYTIIQRHQTRIGADENAPAVVNWKVKYTVLVTYPGGQSDAVQIAWETMDPRQQRNRTRTSCTGPGAADCFPSHAGGRSHHHRSQHRSHRTSRWSGRPRRPFAASCCASASSCESMCPPRRCDSAC